jgi:quinol monooxygenase YgiN
VYREGNRQYQLIVVATRNNPLLQRLYEIWADHKRLRTPLEVRDQLVAEAQVEALITS